jgi:hypothetical protein
VVSLSFGSDAEDDQNAPEYDCHTCLYSMILPVVDDCQPTYIKNFKKKKKKKTKKEKRNTGPKYRYIKCLK